MRRALNVLFAIVNLNLVLPLALVGFTWSTVASVAQDAADLVLTNGKVITVDDRFTVASALAIKGQRITAVGSNTEIEKLKGPTTRVIDLTGRTVIPGLIDNHAHWIRAAEHDEVRFDGITSRARALKLLANRASETPAGEWIAVLGGWSEEQFTDDQSRPTKKLNLAMTTWYAPSVNHWVKRNSKILLDGHVSENTVYELVEYGRR